MKNTVSANIGKQAFTIDMDAYDTLHNYLDDIRSRLPENDTETIGDIEARMAEIFRELLGTSPMRVVTLEHVHKAMHQMGTPADFGEQHDSKSETKCNAVPLPAYTSRKLYRSRTDKIIGGVCGGTAQLLHADPTMVRIVALLLVFFGGLSFWIYIILWIVLPEEPLHKLNTNSKNQ